MSAFLKIPMQFFILFIGIMVFVFYQFVIPPMVFNPVESAKVEGTAQYQTLQTGFNAAHATREQAALKFIDDQSEVNRAAYVAADSSFNEARKNAVNYVKTSTSNPSFNDVNYVFPNFVITYMPMGVIGLIIAAIFAAAMSSVSAELNALATASTIDFYRRHFNPDGTDRQMVRFGRLATFFWGIFACIVAMYATNLGSLIEVVNTFGSFFYGSLLGVFVLAIGVRRARSRGAFFGLLVGIFTVLFTSFVHVSGGDYYLSIPALRLDFTWSKFLLDLPSFRSFGTDPLGKPAIEFLWLNLVGCVATTVAGYLISLTVRDSEPIREREGE